MKVLYVTLVVLLLATLHFSAAALFDGCDYSYTLNAGVSYLESPYFPNNYPTRTSCRYKFTAPLDYQIQVNCTIWLPKTTSCTTEFLYFAREGNTDLQGAEQFCGTGYVVRNSAFRTIVLAYASYGSSGRFQCKFTVTPKPCDCGWSVNTKIVNGQETSINEYPGIVALRDITSNLQAFCAGALLSHYWIVTAAHCTSQQPTASNLEALVGDHNLGTTGETRYAVRHRIAQIIQHPQYTSNPVRNDIALLRTSTAVDWSRGVGPICLPSTSSNSYVYNYADVMGWGTTFFGGPTSPALRKVTLMVITKAACQTAYQGVATIGDDQICTYDYTGNNKDSCQYDSGGPVILQGQARQVLIGCISFGRICGQGGYATGINTRITYFLPWIKQFVTGICPVSV